MNAHERAPETIEEAQARLADVFGRGYGDGIDGEPQTLHADSQEGRWYRAGYKLALIELACEASGVKELHVQFRQS